MDCLDLERIKDEFLEQKIIQDEEALSDEYCTVKQQSRCTQEGVVKELETYLMLLAFLIKLW